VVTAWRAAYIFGFFRAVGAFVAGDSRGGVYAIFLSERSIKIDVISSASSLPLSSGWAIYGVTVADVSQHQTIIIDAFILAITPGDTLQLRSSASALVVLLAKWDLMVVFFGRTARRTIGCDLNC
jgi:hypothetical protein